MKLFFSEMLINDCIDEAYLNGLTFVTRLSHACNSLPSYGIWNDFAFLLFVLIGNLLKCAFKGELHVWISFHRRCQSMFCPGLPQPYKVREWFQWNAFYEKIFVSHWEKEQSMFWTGDDQYFPVTESDFNGWEQSKEIIFRSDYICSS